MSRGATFGVRYGDLWSNRLNIPNLSSFRTIILAQKCSRVYQGLSAESAEECFAFHF
jgi:hypothetical protein